MTIHPKDNLLLFGKLLARLLQGASGLAGGIVLLLVPVVVLISQGLLPGWGGEQGSDTIKASPSAVIAIFAMLALILAAMFLFFGKLHAIIASVGEGDPFTPGNAKRLDAMAWLFLAVQLLFLLVGWVRLHLANRLGEGTDGPDRLDIGLYDVDAIVIIVVLFILARVFRHGAAMREDLEGTV